MSLGQPQDRQEESKDIRNRFVMIGAEAQQAGCTAAWRSTTRGSW
jgi:hypothetical protein